MSRTALFVTVQDDSTASCRRREAAKLFTASVMSLDFTFQLLSLLRVRIALSPTAHSMSTQKSGHAGTL